MAKQSVYIDTTVPSAYFDERTPDRQRLTQEFWRNRLGDFEGLISNLVQAEIEDTPALTRRLEMEQLVRSLTVLEFDPEAATLAREYVRRGIFPQKFFSDAQHVALAVSKSVGLLVSWNFTHLVRLQTRREVNLVNALMGYGAIEIIAPPEL